MGIEVGIERITPRHVFQVDLRTGKRHESETDGSIGYLRDSVKIGDVVGVQVEGGTMGIWVNDEY